MNETTLVKDIRIINDNFQNFKRYNIPKETNKAGAMIVFCSFEQQSMVIQFVQNCEYGLLLYRDKLPKFNNDGRMIFNCMDLERDTTKKIHPTQKPIRLMGLR